MAWAKGLGLGKAKGGKDTKWMVVVDGQAEALSVSEIKRLQPTIETIGVPRKGGGQPRQKSCSDPLGQRRLKGDIELICP